MLQRYLRDGIRGNETRGFAKRGEAQHAQSSVGRAKGLGTGRLELDRHSIAARKLRTSNMKRLGMPQLAGRLFLFFVFLVEGFDVGRDGHRVAATPDEQSLDGTNVNVVAAPGNRDVVVGDDQVVCRVDIDPA